MSGSTGTGSDIKRFIGLILIVVGVLWAAASGLCTAVMFASLLVESDEVYLREMLSITPVFLLVGGFSAGMGFVLYVVGRALRPKT
ncbi:MAG: hypothetical protein ABL996_22315 [Micropepsaceae bacterium]